MVQVSMKEQPSYQAWEIDVDEMMERIDWWGEEGEIIGDLKEIVYEMQRNFIDYGQWVHRTYEKESSDGA